jgi:cytokinin dehydrogenase
MELRGRIRGAVMEPAPEQYHRDFGNTRRRAPRAVIVPATAEDVQIVVAEARRLGLRVVPRGHACSSDGQSLSDHLVLDTTSLRDLELDEDNTVSVGPGMRWGELEDELWRRGRSNRVLVDNALSTVGGTLSVGGIGTTSHHLGAQVDQVVSIDVVTGAGDLVTAARGGPHEELFEYTLCGLGQTGIITRARLLTRPRPRGTLLERRHLPPTESLRAVAESILGSGPWDHCLLSFVLTRSSWQVVVGKDIDASAEVPETGPGKLFLERYSQQRFAVAAAFLPAFTKIQIYAGMLASPDAACNVWSDFLVPSRSAETLSDLVRPLASDPRMTPGPLGIVLQAPEGRPGLPLSPIPDAPLVLSLGANCMVPPALVPEYQRRFHRAAETCVEHGGRVYLYGCHPRTEAFYRAQFGEQTFAAWQAVKERYDPLHLIGTELFES